VKTRTEHDALGKKKVPANAYFGVHTQRAYENFPISGTTEEQEMIRAIAMIKIATCRANASLHLLGKKKANVIERAAKEVGIGKFNDQFVVDVYQAGAGTATHMNVNEVIANRAIELLGGKKGDYTLVHPNDDVNMGQSTNDVFPSAIRIAVLPLIDAVVSSSQKLEKSLLRKAKAFNSILKSGRTHLQDAVPIRLGQEFKAWALTVKKQWQSLLDTKKRIRKLSIGGTAIGTGINTHPKYRSLAIKELRKVTKLKVESATDLIEATQSMEDFLHVSSALREYAVELTRICNDIKLLSSGPRTGMHELVLPAVEPGSSIMPGKINPSMAEMLTMVCFQVMGNDRVIELAAQAGQLELNVMMPLISHNLIQSLKILGNAVREFDERCVRGISANKKSCDYYFEYGLALPTLLNPIIGYEKAAEIAKIALRQDKTVSQVILEKKILTKKQLKKIFDPKRVTKPNIL